MTHITEPLDKVFEYLRGKTGSIRVKMVQDAYFNQEILNQEEVVKVFKTWQRETEWIVLVKQIEYVQDFERERLLLDYEYVFLKAAKRGNDVYRALVQKKLKPLQDLQPITFFTPEWGVKATNMLFITLTYDPSLKTSQEAWATIGEDWHLFLSKLRQHDGEISFLRSWESTQNFYPHIHACIIFKDHDFEAFEHVGKDNVLRYRVVAQEKERIASYWHSHVDIQAVENTDKALQEIVKYITKEIWTQKGDKTNAMVWVHGKQQYAVSRSFGPLLNSQLVDVDLGPPTVADLIAPHLYNCNETFYYFGIISNLAAKLDPQVWAHTIKKPPPRIVELILEEQTRQFLNSGYSDY